MWSRIGYFGLILFATTLVSNNVVGALPLKPSAQDEITSLPQSSAKLSQYSISQSKRELIRQLLEISGGKKRYDENQQLLLTQMNQDLPKILQQMIESSPGLAKLTKAQKQDAYAQVTRNTSSFFNEFSQYIQSESTYQEILNRVYYPTYDQYFSESDLKDLISFYKTPIGIKILLVSPQLSATSQRLTSEIIMPHLSQILGRMMEQQINSGRTTLTVPLK